MSLRLRFGLWLAAALLLIGWFVLQVQPRLVIETNILALLPADERDVALEQALRHHADGASRRNLFLIGADSGARARAAAARFAQNLRDSGAFTAVQCEIDEEDASLAGLRRARFGLLPAQHRRWLEQGEDAALYADALAALYSPLDLRPLPIAEDPFNFLGAFISERLQRLGGARPEGGMLMLSAGDREYVLVVAESRLSPYAVAAQEQLVPAVAAAIGSAEGAGAQVIGSGVLQHAAAAARQARREIGIVGSISMAGVLALVFVTFGSLRPLLLALGTLGLGTLAAITICHHLFGPLHLITLVFGASLIGVAIDYSNHFLADQFRDPAWTAPAALAHVGPALVIGMGCAVLGYAGLALAPLPGLRQMAVFAATGLIVACFTVLAAYPVLATRARRPPGALLDGLRWLASAAQRAAAHRALMAGLAGLALLGLLRVQFNDDVRQLQPVLPALLAQEQQLRTLLQDVPDSRFFVVEGADAEELLQRQEQLNAALDAQIDAGALDGYRDFAQTLPSLRRQTHNRALLARRVYRHGGLLPQLGAEIGLSDAQVKTLQAEFAAADRGLELKAWLDSPLGQADRALLLQPYGSGIAAVVLLVEVRDAAALAALNLPGASFIDAVDQTSRLLARYRELALALVAAAYALIGLLLWRRYGGRAALRLLAVPLGAAALTLGVLGWIGSALSLFHVLGLFMVLGLGMDYAVFLHEARAARLVAVLAITLSTLGTMLSYGLLAFSATPFVHALGLTLLLGILLTYALALLLQRGAHPDDRPAA